MKVIWSNVVLYLVTLVALVVYRNTGEDTHGWFISLLGALFVWLMIFVTYQVGYGRGRSGKSDGYFIEPRRDS